MAITLLDMLVEAKLITPEQFDEALKNRVLYGGKIGTSLIEMGFIEEEALARFLSKKLAVPYVEPEQLMAISQETIQCIPKDLALKYRVIPLTLEKKRLSLVMADPADLNAIDDIAFITGFIIKPLVSPEVRLVQALGKYYGYPIDNRYQQVIDKMAAKKKTPQPPPAKPEEQPRPAASVPAQPAVATKPIKTTASEKAGSPTPTPPLPTPATQPAADPPQAKAPARPQPIRQPATLTEKLAALQQEKEREKSVKSKQVVSEGAWAERMETYSIATVSKALSQTEDREEIADILVTFLGQEFKRVALFIVRGGAASGWKGVFNSEEIGAFKTVSIPMTRPSVLKTVAEGKSFYLGLMPDTPLDKRLIQGMGGETAGTVLLMPLMIGGRVVCILYVEGGNKVLSNRIGELQKLLTKAALAFEILILKEKILMS